jgi:hypothetical protein
MKSSLSLLALGLVLLSAGCKKDPPEFPVEPTISFVNYGPMQVQEFQDSVAFSIAYEDGDGDLGDAGTGDNNLFLVDKRIPLTYGYRLRDLVPGSASASIKGVVNFTLPNTVIVGSGTQESATFEVYLKDQAGHESNRLVTNAITIVR